MQAPPSSPQGRESALSQTPPWARFVGGVLAVLLILGSGILVHTVLNTLGFGLVGFKGLLITVGVTWALLASVGFILLFIDRLKKISQSASRSDHTDGVVQAEPEFMPPAMSQPGVPEELVKRCAEGTCVLITGTGLSAQAGYPTWATFTKELLNAAIKFDVIDKNSEASLRQPLVQKQLDLVVDTVLNGKNGLDVTSGVLRAMYGELGTTPSEAHKLLSEVPFAGVIATGFDDLVDRVFVGRHDGISHTAMEGEKLLGKLSAKQFFVHRPLGSLRQPESIVWTISGLKDVIATDEKYEKFLKSLTSLQSLLFIGLSFEGVRDFLECMPGPSAYSGSRHFALISVDDPSWEAKASELERRFNVNVLPFARGDNYGEVPAFLRKLVDGIGSKLQHDQVVVTSHGKVNLQKHSPRGVLTSVTLKNIGPFEELELGLDPGWTVLLGDNGVGKSTVLKAIAVGMCGEDAREYAGELIKVRPQGYLQPSVTETATIVLKTHLNPTGYVTNITRTGTRVQVDCPSGRFGDIEKRLTLAFPPLRTMSRSKGERRSIKGLPGQCAPDDLMPLIKGGADPRLEKLKGWILGLHHAANSSDVVQVERDRYGKVLDRFFQMIEVLTPGLTVKRAKIDPITGEICINTDDGEVPLEVVSQGTTSLLGWVGILIQRLHEFYANEDEWSAVVLIDELDAHMHPRWQRLLITSLETLFPAVQFIATTHSPLIVGGMSANQVARVIRDEHGRVVLKTIDQEALVGRADQILTGDLFDMETTIDRTTELQMDEYRKLLGMSKRNSDQEAKFRKLRDIIRFRVPSSAETPVERRAQQLLEALVMDQFDQNQKATQEALVAKAKDLFEAVKKQV